MTAPIRPDKKDTRRKLHAPIMPTVPNPNHDPNSRVTAIKSDSTAAPKKPNVLERISAKIDSIGKANGAKLDTLFTTGMNPKRLAEMRADTTRKRVPPMTMMEQRDFVKKQHAEKTLKKGK